MLPSSSAAKASRSAAPALPNVVGPSTSHQACSPRAPANVPSAGAVQFSLSGSSAAPLRTNKSSRRSRPVASRAGSSAACGASSSAQNNHANQASSVGLREPLTNTGCRQFVLTDYTGAVLSAQNIRRTSRPAAKRSRPTNGCGTSSSAQGSSSGSPIFGANVGSSTKRQRVRGPGRRTRPVPVVPTSQGDYRDLGDCDQICEYCGASFWFGERLKSYPLSERPRYSICCRHGRVKMDYPVAPPDDIRRLYETVAFHSNIRAYNSMFAMTSFGAKVDDTINDGFGPYVFKVSGQICHWLGSLCPTETPAPRFLQLYIYDTLNEVSNRLSHFSNNEKAALEEGIVQALIQALDRHNELVRLFRTARDICQTSDVADFRVRLYQGSAKHPYGLPSSGTLGAIIYDGDPNANDFDIIVRDKSDVPQRVNHLHPSYMSLQYPLLFPYGEPGWSPTLTVTAASSEDDKRLSMNMFYSYQIHDRPGQYTLLLHAGRLFQQYLVDAYIAIERNRLEYMQSHQSDLRSEFLSGIHDVISRGDREGRTIGKRVLLPSSFTGGPCYMYKNYQDALAICRVHGNPQYFITFTCNVKWPEIQRHTQYDKILTAQDRADIIARVFQMKVDAFLAYLKDEKPFGVVAADLYTIEFQKRGLPHCHTLLWVTDPFRITTPEQVDQHICVEIPDKSIDPILYGIVTETMIHGPCGPLNVSAPCMQDGTCSKHYPMKNENATRFDDRGQVYYKRRADGPTVLKNGVLIGSSYVVPYNKKLCNRFHAHINVEYCGWSMLIKYLFKYISKGTDRIRYSVGSGSAKAKSSAGQATAVIDEVQNFVDGRFICPHEAAWRILNFKIHCRHPAVQALAVHLEGRQNVVFNGDKLLEQVVRNPGSSKTTLTEWLRSNRFDPAGRHLRYVDYLNEYKWVANGKSWMRRTSKREPAIGRVVYIHPASGEIFFLRMLLNHQTGCCSFDDLRTVSSIIMPTYHAACEKLGLIGNDIEWELALEDADTWATAVELRQLFAHMLLYCEVTNPLNLWQKYWKSMSDDFVRTIANEARVPANSVPEDALQQAILCELEKLVGSGSSSASLSEYGLPIPQVKYIGLLENRLLMEERCYDQVALALEHQKLCSSMHPRQTEIYSVVMDSLATSTQVLLFVYGHGGTGKTFLWKAITSGLRSKGKIVLTVAASGIAALLLPSGRIAHSRFKIPIKITEESLCNVKKNTKMAELLLQATLIIWDEAPMSDRRCLEALDRTLQDLLDNKRMPFGGKSILLGGDFRQTLPVKKGATKTQTISLSLPRSSLWKHFKVYRLTENMRLHRPDMTATEREAVHRFSAWLLSIGDGTAGNIAAGGSVDTRDVIIPQEYIIPYNDNALVELIGFIYDQDTLNCPTTDNLHDKAIVCPKNETA